MDENAKALYFKDNPILSVLSDRAKARWWSAEDESTRLHYRLEAEKMRVDALSSEAFVRELRDEWRF